MESTTIRIRSKSHEALKEIAAATGQSLQDILDQAIEERRRKLYLQGLDSDYAALKQRAKAQKEFERENAVWDRTNLDGLEDE